MGEQYLCRAKRLDNGEWIKGYLVPLGKKSFSDPDQYGMIEKAIPVGSQNNPVLYNMYIIEVDPQTICWRVGLPDKNGKEVFKGDICNTKFFGKESGNGRNFNDYDTFQVIYHMGNYCFDNETRRFSFAHMRDIKDLEVIGNIFDNPELLKGGRS